MTVRELQEVFISSCKIVELQEIGEIDIKGSCWKCALTNTLYDGDLGKLQNAELLDHEIKMIMNIPNRQGIPFLEITLK